MKGQDSEKDEEIRKRTISELLYFKESRAKVQNTCRICFRNIPPNHIFYVTNFGYCCRDCKKLKEKESSCPVVNNTAK
jgi:hypothetical protein